ncbi:MAG: hypothetical protein M1834_006423 [Cirrosporium novae-zelandiae]|nr:MAG: hypothetical protein M1834_006423 [Cirrosporium novae-zelandiae]
MPRMAAENCDGQLPVCQNCTRRRLNCQRPDKSLRFVIHTDQPPPEVGPSVGRNVESSLHLPESREQGTCDSLKQANELAFSVPRVALESTEITSLFRHYIDILAPWHDLNDSQRYFSTIVPVRAMDTSILFRAIIAFSAFHWYRTTGKLQNVATAFHGACVIELLEVMNSSLEPSGDYLASTCLLRSYEILNGDMSDQQRPLSAHTFSLTDNVNLSRWGLHQAPTWAYLRDEINIGLERRRPVGINTDFASFKADDYVDDDMKANLMAYILARIMNFCFQDHLQAPTQETKISLWRDLRADLTLWTHSLPATFDPISTAPKPGNLFPSYWMLHPWHVSALQHASTAEILLALYDPSSPSDPTPHFAQRAASDFIHKHVMRICGLARTNDDGASRVNSFGPLSFCGRYLIGEDHREELETMLFNFELSSAWPVNPIVNDLRQAWAGN